MKKLLLSFVLMLTATIAAWAQYVVVDDVRYQLSSDKAYVVAPESGVYTGAIAIPATISSGGNDYAVTDIKSGAFENSTITSLSLPVGLKYIFSSFAGTSLTSLTIPGTVTYLTGMGSCTSLTSITFTYDGIDGITDEYYWPSGYQKAIELSWDCFTGCTNLTEINVDRPLYNRGANSTALFGKATKATFGPHATNIPMACFYKVTTLQQLTIGANVTEIETNAFKQGALPTGYAFPFSQLKKIETEAFMECQNLPAAIDLSSAEEIENQAFCRCLDIQSATLGSCEHAGAFWGCTNLTSLTLLDGITEISNSAFSNMTNLTNIKLPSTLKKIGNQAFYGCENLNFSDGLPEGLEEIDNSAFYNCYKLDVTLPSTLTRIGEYAFYKTGIKTVNIPAGVTKLEGYTFMYSAVETVTIPGSITEVGRYEFSDCQNLKTVTIENGATVLALNDIFDNCDNVETMNIDRNFTVDSSNPAFSRTAQMTVNLGSHVTEIPLHAFQECSFTAFTIPGTVKYVRGRSLPTTLTSLTLLAGEETLTFDQMALGQFASDVNVTDLNIDRNYTNYGGKPLSEKVKRVTFGNHVTAIESGAFQSCSLEQAITFPSSLKEIGYNAFRSCTVSAITLNEGLETIGDYAFNQCTATFNGIPSTLTSIGQSAFSQCTGLTGALVIPAGVTQLAMSTFYGTGITSVTIPGTVTKINTSDFGNCANLTTVTLLSGEAPLTIGKRCFYSSDNITDVTIDRDFTYYNDLEKNRSPFNTAIERVTFGTNVTRVGDRALASCMSLTDVVLPDNITTIGIEAFKWSKPASLTLSKNLTTVEDYGFYGMVGPASFTLPISLNEVGKEAFYNITNLTGVYVPWIDAPITLTNDTETEKTFSYSADQTLWIPGGTLASYQAADGWKRFQNFDYWSFVVTADVAGKGTLTVANGEAVTDNGTNTEKSVTGENLVEAGAGTPVSGLFVREKDLTFTATPARGYELSALTANSADIKAAAKVTNLLADQTIHATFTPIIYNIVYNNLLNGVVDPANPATYTVEDAAITLVNPTRTAYNFKGWTGTDLTEATMTVTIPASSIGNREYTATWEAIVYNITYDLAGGAVDPANKDKYTIETADFTLTNPTRTGYTFTGWTGTDLTGKTMTVTVTTGHYGPRSYTATWEPNPYQVAFNANNGQGTMANQNFVYDAEQALTANAFTRTGYTFKEWNTKADGTGTSYADKQSVKNLTAERDAVVTLYAQWTPITYFVRFNANEGTGTMSNQTLTYDKAQALTANAFTRKGYDFKQWATKADGSGDNYADKASVVNLSATQDAVVDLYAQWERKTYTVSITSNVDGLVTASTTSPKYEDDVVLTIGSNEDYKLQTLTVNGTDVTSLIASGKYTITKVEDNVTVVATFEATKAVITLAHAQATYSCTQALDFTGITGLKAYIASGYSNGKVLLTRVDVVPANTGLLLVGTEGETYKVPFTTTTAFYSNLLKPVTTAKVIPATEGDYTNFLYGEVEGVKGFYKSSGTGTVAAGKAYLQLPTSAVPASGARISIVLDDEATGISNMTTYSTPGVVYDLNGRKVADEFNPKRLPKGVYIVDGQKRVVNK